MTTLQESKPGKNGKLFKITLSDDYFRKGDIINLTPYGQKGRIIKVYHRTWWRRVLTIFGFKTKWFTFQVENIGY